MKTSMSIVEKLGGKPWKEEMEKIDYSVMTRERAVKEIDQLKGLGKIVTFNWLYDCFFNMKKMDEADYEIKA